jgi:hypothetical protein
MIFILTYGHTSTSIVRYVSFIRIFPLICFSHFSIHFQAWFLFLCIFYIYFELWFPTIVLTRFCKKDCKSSFMVLGKYIFVERQLKVKRDFLHKWFQLCPFLPEFLAGNTKCSRMGNWHVGFSFGLLINGCL